MTIHKGFQINESTTPKVFGVQEDQTLRAVIDTVVGDSLQQTSASSGHYHNKLYATSGGQVALSATSTGNIGIGTAATCRLDINGSSHMSDITINMPFVDGDAIVNVRSKNSDSADSAISITSNNQMWRFGVWATDTGIFNIGSDNGTINMNNAGNVGIGTDTINGILDVVKDVGTDARLGIRTSVGIQTGTGWTENLDEGLIILRGRGDMTGNSKRLLPYAHKEGVWVGKVKLFAYKPTTMDTDSLEFFLYGTPNCIVPYQQWEYHGGAHSGELNFVSINVVYDANDYDNLFPGIDIVTAPGSDPVEVMYEVIAQVMG